MSNRNFDQSWCLGKRIIEMVGSFDTNGGANPVAVRGQGFRKTAVVRTGVGSYLVTFDDPYLDVNGLSADLQVAAASANWAQCGPIANLGTATPATLVVFTINSAGAAVDIAANASSRVTFTAIFRDSNVGFTKP